jgi:hypothetical protein
MPRPVHFEIPADNAVKAAKQAEKPAVAKRGVRKKATAKEAA